MFKGKKKVYILNTIVVLTIIMISFSILGMWPFGGKSIAAIDLSGQYLGFYDYLGGVFEGTEGVFYSFNKGAGGGMFALWTYYLMSPFNLVYAFYNGDSVLQGVQIVYLLKMVALTLAATHYFKRKGLEDTYNTMFTLGWVFSGYITMFRIHLMWLDALIYLPLLILALEEGLNSNKYGKYVLLLTLTIYSSYYIGYMVGLFTIIYALYSYYTKDEGQPFYLVGYIKGCILSGILSLWVLIPTAYSMVGGLRTSKIDGLFFNYYPANLFSTLRFIDTSSIGYSSGAPLLMFGTALVVCLAIVLRHTTKKQKVAYGVVALFYLLTFTIRPLGRIWTIGQDETWYMHRSAFTFVWFNIAFVANNKQYLKNELSRLQAILLTCVWLGSSIFIYFQEGSTYTIIGVITFIIALFFGVVINVRFTGKELALVGLLSLEVFTMMVYQGLSVEHRDIANVKGNYIKQAETMQVVNKKREPMSRVYFGVHNEIYNNGFTLGESTLAHTSSTIGESFRYLYNQLGLLESYSLVGVVGMNGVAATLLNVEYIDTQFNEHYTGYLNESTQFEQLSDTLYYNNSRLGLGYTVDDLIESKGRDLNFNGITSVITGKTYADEIKLDIIESYNVELTEDKYTIQDIKDQAYITYKLRDDVNYVYKNRETISAKPKDEQTDDEASNTTELGADDAVEDELKNGGSKVQNMLGNYLMGVKHDGDGTYRFQIKFDELVLDKTDRQPKFYNIDMGAFAEDIQGYFDTHSSFTLTEQGKGKLSGTVNNEHKDPYLQVSIPYEEGWVAYVNGAEQEVLNSMDYLAVEIPEGEVEVELVYHTPLLRESVIIVVVLLIGYVIVDVMVKRYKNKKNITQKLDEDE